MPRPAARQRPTGPALLTVVVALALTPAAATAATVRVSTSGNDSTCTRDGSACATLGQGVAIAAPGDVVAVGAGDFPVGATDGAGVRITKPLDLRGAQYNVDARTRSGAETVLHPALGAGPYQGLLYVDTGAAGTSIRGFRIQGTAASGGLGGAGIYTEQSGTDGGYTISENVLANNSIGLLLHASGSVVTTVARNAFLANTLGADAGGAFGAERDPVAARWV